MRNSEGQRSVDRDHRQTKTQLAAKTAKKPNATLGTRADRAELNDHAAYLRAMWQTRATSQRRADAEALAHGDGTMLGLYFPLLAGWREWNT